MVVYASMYFHVDTGVSKITAAWLLPIVRGLPIVAGSTSHLPYIGSHRCGCCIRRACCVSPSKSSTRLVDCHLKLCFVGYRDSAFHARPGSLFPAFDRIQLASSRSHRIRLFTPRAFRPGWVWYNASRPSLSEDTSHGSYFESLSRSDPVCRWILRRFIIVGIRTCLAFLRSCIHFTLKVSFQYGVVGFYISYWDYGFSHEYIGARDAL